MASSARSMRIEKRLARCEANSQPGTSSANNMETVKVTKNGKKLKSEVQTEQIIDVPAVSRSTSQRSKRSSASSIIAQKKRLELQAAQEKARIQMELIDKKLEADLAAVEEQFSSPPSVCDQQSREEDVEKWLEESQQQLEKQRASTDGTNKGPLLNPPPERVGPEGPVEQLVNAVKELVTTSMSTNQNANLLSRISTPRELPVFFGDPMEWLAFKQAYEESTTLCNFTDRENIWRLRKCLRGPAKDAVSALLITATSPKVVMSTLELQFGNPDVILSRIMLDIKRMNSLSHEYHKDIVPFSIKVQNYVAAVRALNREEYLQGVNVANIVLSKMPTVLLSKWSDYSYQAIITGSKSRMDILSSFLNEEAIKISTCSANLLNTRMDNRRKFFSDNQNNQPQTVLLQSMQKSVRSDSDDKCRFCRVSKHKLPECRKFKKSLRKDRWAYVKRAGICYKCLISHHERQTCPAAACDVDSCGESHHRLLHYVPNSRRNETADVQVIDSINDNVSGSDSQSNVQSDIVTHIKSNSCAVLLQVVMVNIHGPNGVYSAIALLDSGSTVTLISRRLSVRVGLRGRKQTLHARGAWDNTGLVCESEIINLTLSNKDGIMYSISARSVNELNLPIQNLLNINYEKYKYLRNLRHELCTGHLKPEIVIGQDNYHLMLPLETVTGLPNEPCATRTPLGWCLHGRVMSSSSSQVAHHSTLHIVDGVTEDLNDLNEVVRRSFAIESMGISASKPRQNSEDQRAWDHLEKTSKLVDGKWYVGLPWKDNNCVMPNSYTHALSRLKGVEVKMKRNKEYAEKYRERVQHLLTNDYAEELKDITFTPKTWYLPHFGLENPNKKKLRLIFDAASKVDGLSLNDYLLRGPDLLMPLFGIMLRFRENRIGVAADIKDMFLRVKIRSEDRDSLRFIFRDSPEIKTNDTTELKTYVMTSLIFGANCSPFIAQFIKNKNARRFESRMQSAATAIYTQHYMDDYIDSLPDEETAIKLIREIIYIHSQGNFELRNWNSNSIAVLDSVPKSTLGNAAVKFKIGQQNYEGERTLGIIWYPSDDTLGFELSFKKIPEKIMNGEQRPSKREILRVVMTIFDVYGFLSPFTIIGKIILQETWRLNIDWDDRIPDEINNRWNKWINLLHTIKEIRLPRYYVSATRGASETKDKPTNRAASSHLREDDVIRCATQPLRGVAPMPSILTADTLATPRSIDIASTTLANDNNKNALITNSCYKNLQLHIFCDASTKAICAVAYWRWINNEDSICVAFICSRSRLAGNKAITIPRLELQAALLAARLADTITKEHKMTAQQRIFWSDSTTVLHWIRNDARNYKIYIANRLGEIDDLTQINEWRYVPTNKNVADIGTRETYDSSILCQEWLHGPTFLRESEKDWPRDVISSPMNEASIECVSTINTEPNNLPVPDPTRFSSWLRLLKTMHRVLLFINRVMRGIHGKFKDRIYTYNYEDTGIEKAELILLRYSQNQSFGLEIALLKNKNKIPTSSKLLTLSPYLDEHGVLRAGGRIDAAPGVAPEIKRPIILDGRDYITRLIVRHYHIQAAHGNQELVVNNLKQKFWIIRLRPTVKSVVSKCMLCRMRKCKPEIPRLGDLPEARMAHHQRPFSYCGTDLFGPMEVTVGRRHERRYGVLFTCLTVRAVHIEVVPTLTSDSYIMALRRMAARRGWPIQMYSDNGTNLRGADNDLKKSILELNQQVLSDEALNHGTKWTFIPPASPHWGGAWERLIRSIKTSLSVVLKERAPKEETLLTLLAEVENIVNSRPLTHVSVEPGSTESLTPNHFLLGSSSNLPQIGVFDDSEFYLRRQWRISQRLTDMFWKRWLREVLPEMIPRRKWNEDIRPLRVGDLVFVVDSSSPRYHWPKGIITEIFPGRDGRVRTVTVKIQTGYLKRSVTRVARIQVVDECC